MSNSWEEKSREEGIEQGIEKVVRGMLQKKLSIDLIVEVNVGQNGIYNWSNWISYDFRGYSSSKKACDSSLITVRMLKNGDE